MSKKHEYPKYVYHKSQGAKLVTSSDEHEALGKGWHEEPQAELKGDKGDDPGYAKGEFHDTPAPVEAHSTVKHGADEKRGTNAKTGLK